MAVIGNFQEEQRHLLLISQHNSMSNLLCTGATKNFVLLHNDSKNAKLPPYLEMSASRKPGADQDSRRRGRQPSRGPTYDFAKFSKKLHEMHHFISDTGNPSFWKLNFYFWKKWVTYWSVESITPNTQVLYRQLFVSSQCDFHTCDSKYHDP